MKKKAETTSARKQSKSFPNEIKFALESFVILAITLGITLPVHFTFGSYNWHWVFFTWIFILVPVGLVSFKAYAESREKYTNEQKQNASTKIGNTILWYWYLDCVYMTIFNNWTVAMYITSIMALIFIFYGLAVNFLNRKQKNIFLEKSLVFDFLIGVCLTVYLIYTIEDAALQTIVTAVVAAVFGGLLTLVGVAWTIKDANQNKKKEEIQKAEPLFAFNMLRVVPTLSETVERVCFPANPETQYACEVYAQIENSNKNAFTLKRIYHDGEWVNLEGNVVVLPSSKCILAFNFNNYPKNIYLEVEDELSNKHYYQLSVLCLGAKIEEGIFQHTIRGITKTDSSKIEKGE